MLSEYEISRDSGSQGFEDQNFSGDCEVVAMLKEMAKQQREPLLTIVSRPVNQDSFPSPIAVESSHRVETMEPTITIQGSIPAIEDPMSHAPNTSTGTDLGTETCQEIANRIHDWISDHKDAFHGTQRLDESSTGRGRSNIGMHASFIIVTVDKTIKVVDDAVRFGKKKIFLGTRRLFTYYPEKHEQQTHAYDLHFGAFHVLTTDKFGARLIVIIPNAIFKDEHEINAAIYKRHIAEQVGFSSELLLKKRFLLNPFEKGNVQDLFLKRNDAKDLLNQQQVNLYYQIHVDGEALPASLLSSRSQTAAKTATGSDGNENTVVPTSKTAPEATTTDDVDRSSGCLTSKTNVPAPSPCIFPTKIERLVTATPMSGEGTSAETIYPGLEATPARQASERHRDQATSTVVAVKPAPQDDKEMSPKNAVNTSTPIRTVSVAALVPPALPTKFSQRHIRRDSFARQCLQAVIAKQRLQQLSLILQSMLRANEPITCTSQGGMSPGHQAYNSAFVPGLAPQQPGKGRSGVKRTSSQREEDEWTRAQRGRPAASDEN